MTINVVFDPPLPSDSREDFNAKAFDTVSKLNQWSVEANQTAQDINDDKVAVEQARDDAEAAQQAAEDARDLAQSSATTAVSAKNDAVAAKNLAEAAKEAAEDAAEAAQTWNPSEYVAKAGGTMTGHLSVPAGATGSQVPRSSEVVHMTGDETIAGVKTFSSRPKVPAGATGTEVPQAQEIFGKGQSWQVVTRVSGVTYTNSTGKPITVVASAAVTGSAPGIIYIEVDGAYADQDWGWELGASMVINFVVPPGSTYKITGVNASAIDAREYR